MKKSRKKIYRIIRTIFGVTVVGAAAWFYLGSYGVVASPFDVIRGKGFLEGATARNADSSSDSSSERLPDIPDKEDQTEETGAAVVTPTPAPEPLEPSWQIENVPHIYQYDDYPTGCESVSTVIALQYSGIDISVDTFIDDYLTIGTLWENSEGQIIGPDMDDAYIGDPRSVHGCGCNAPAIVKAVRKLLPGTGNKVLNLTGMEMEDLCRDYICQDIPVILWATIGMQEWTETITWEIENGAGTVTFYSAEHCLVLTGYDEEFYYFSDPASREEIKGYEKEAVEKAYDKLGCQAVAILPPEEEEN